MRLIETDRLFLRRLTPEDAPFILKLVNDPDWLRYIGDKQIHSPKAARLYILNGPMAMYETHGFGLYLVSRRDKSTPIGICGLIKRDTLDDVDVGFAFLRRYRRKGFATEAVAATIEYARNVIGLDRIVAIVTPENSASVRLLERQGFVYERMLQFADSDTVCLYGLAIYES